MKDYLNDRRYKEKCADDFSRRKTNKQAMRNEARVLMKTSQHHQDSFLVTVRDFAAMWG